MPTPQENAPSTNQTESQQRSPTGEAMSSHPDSRYLDLEAVIARLYGATPPSTSPTRYATAAAPGSPNEIGRRSAQARIGGLVSIVPVLTPSEKASLQLTKPSSTMPEKPSTSSSIPSSPATGQVERVTLRSVESTPHRHQYVTFEEYTERMEQEFLRRLQTNQARPSRARFSSSMLDAAALSPTPYSPNGSGGLSQGSEPPTRRSQGTVDPLETYDPRDEGLLDPYYRLPDGDL